MTWIDIIAMAVSNLWRRKLRTILTVLGVIIGTACIVIMVALGLGNLQQFEQSILESTSLTEIQVYGYSNSGGESKITDSVIDSFKQMTGVRAATAVMQLPAYMKIGKYSADLSILCVDPDAMAFDIEEGRVFEDANNPEIVLGSNVKQSFMDKKSRDAMNSGSYSSMMVMDVSGEAAVPAGPDIDWMNETFMFYPSSSYQMENPDTTSTVPAPKPYKAKITGLLIPAEDEQSYNAYMSLDEGKRIFRENRKLMESYGLSSNSYNQAYIYVNSIEDVTSVLESVKAMGLEAYSPTEWITQMQDEQKRQQGQLSLIGMISLVISAIGIANTMLASILERRREIGVMKVIGLSVSKINLMFLAEAALIGLVGGLIGVGLSYAFALFAGSIAGQETTFFGMYFSNGVQLVIPFWLSLGAVAIATGVGIVSGIYPAWRATKLSPLEAIRSIQ